MPHDPPGRARERPASLTPEPGGKLHEAPPRPLHAAGRLPRGTRRAGLGQAQSSTNRGFYATDDKGSTFGDGDLNPGDPFVTGSAYTSSALSATPPASTTLYAMETLQDAITIQAPPNAGTLGTLRYPRKNVLRVAGFDIAGSPDTGYIATRTGAGGARLLRANLGNASNADLGRIGPPGSVVTGLAAQQDSAAPAAD